jgi:hypothetical protein
MITNREIKRLNARLLDASGSVSDIKSKLQNAYNKAFDADPVLKKALIDAENASEYQFNRYGEVQSWWRFSDLEDYADCREYLEEWLKDNSVYLDGDCLTMSQGECILVNLDAREHRDYFAYLNDHCSGVEIVKRAECLDDEGEIDETKLFERIEAWMDKHGNFPGVYRTNSHGDVFIYADYYKRLRETNEIKRLCKV